MSGLRNLVDKLKPTFSEGGKLSFLASTFDAFETFLFVPNTTTQKGAHIRDCNDMKRTMIVVVVALLPALLFGMYNTGGHDGLGGFLVRIPASAADDRRVVRRGSGHRVRFRAGARPRSQRGLPRFGSVDPDGDARGDAAVDDRAGYGLRRGLRQGGLRRYGHERIQPRAAGARLRLLRLHPADVG